MRHLPLPWIPPANGREWLSLLWLPSLVMLVGSLVTWQFATEDQDETRKKLETRFEARAERLHQAVADRLLAHEQILRGGAALFDAAGVVTRAQWATYVASLQLPQRFPGVQGMGFAQFVPAPALHNFVTGMRTQGVPTYAVRPEGARDFYLPVTYLEPPSDRNLRALGFDMATEPLRRAAMEQARDTGKAAITGKLKLVSESQASVAGVLMYLPVYRRDAILDTPAARAAALVGFVNSPLRIGDILQGTLGAQASEIGLKVYDGRQVLDDALMYEQAPAGGAGESERASHTVPRRTQAIELPFSNRAWTLVFHADTNPRAFEQHSLLWIVGAGLSASLLVAALAFGAALWVRTTRISARHYFTMANFDQLTGLPNRSMFLDRLDRAVLKAERNNAGLAVAFIDVDHFKAVNDSKGHAAGDKLLQEVAQRLRDSVRRSDTAARLSGDEFIAVLEEVHSEADVTRIAAHIRKAMAEPVDLSGHAHHISLSIGFALYPQHGNDAESLLKAADEAMYAAKRSGRDRWALATS
jgi:diguanylate cyclase